MAVLVILGVLAAVAFKRVVVINYNAELKAVQAGIAELNSREILTWTDEMFAQGGWSDDSAVWGSMNTDLGEDYKWPGSPDASGGTLRFGSQVVALTRTPSEPTTSARWRIE
jgi:hypothetical protein